MLVESHPWAVKEQDTVAVAGVTQELISANATRRYLIIQNLGNKAIFVAIGRDATLLDLEISPGGNYEPVFVPREAINVIASGSTVAHFIEGQ